MRHIEHEGKVYQVLDWQKPEDTDYAFGEMVIAVYAAIHFVYPILAIAKDDHRFVPMLWRRGCNLEEIPQPLYVMSMPIIGKEGYITECPGVFNQKKATNNETD